MDMEFANGVEPVRKMDKVVLDTFWTLAEGNDSARVRAAEKLCEIIILNKSKDPDTGLSQQNYSLKRLVRGLASNRKFARVGFAVALTKLLRQVKDVKVKHVLETIAEELKVSAHDPKSEIGSKLLGCVFAYGALVQSGRKLKDKQLSVVVTELLALGEKKSYIRPSCTQTLVDLLGQVTPQQVAETVWPLLRASLDKGWEECTPDRLLLLLECHKKDKMLVNKAYLKTHWGGAKIFGKKNFEYILHLLRRSVEYPQSLPVLLEAIVKEVTQELGNTEELAEFWTKVGNPLLASTIPRKQVSVMLFCQLLEQTSDPNLTQKMLFPAMAAVICKTADKKDEQLDDVCNRATSLLTELCRKQTEGEFVLSIVKGFLQTCHRLKSINFLRSNKFSSFVSCLQGDSMELFTQMCMDCIVGKGDLLPQTEKEKQEDEDEKDKEEEKEEESKEGGMTPREKFCQHLVPLFRVTALSPTGQQSGLTCRTLQFLFLHTFFKVTKATKDIPHCGEASPDFSPSMRNVFQATFYRTLTQLLSMRPDRRGEQEQMLNYITVLTDLALYAQKLLKSCKTVQPVKEISEEVQNEWSTITDIITAKADKKRASAENVLGETKAFTLLILHLAFDLFTEPEPTSELLQDIYVCRQKASKKQSAKHADDGEPHWVEVVTEILLSMLSRASKLARKTTVTVFKSLSCHLTPAAVRLITEVLKGDKSKKNDDLFEFEDMEVDANGEAADSNSDDDNDDDKEEDMPTDEDSDEDDDDEEDNDEEVDEKLRQSVKTALGSAAAATDDEEEEVDFSDSDMFKLDEQLAAAFRSMKRVTKKEKKEKRREVASFRLRAFDLLEVIIRGDRCGDFVLELLVPLLQMVKLQYIGQQTEGQSDVRQLSSRATELFNVMCKQRNLADHLHTHKEMLDTTSSLLSMANSGSSPQFAGDVANGCLCIMRLMSHQPEAEPSPVKVSGQKKTSVPSHQEAQEAFVHTMQKALQKDLLKNKITKLGMAFFSALIEKYPNVFWPLTSTLQTALQSSDTKVHTKMQVCSLLVLLLRNNKKDAISHEQWDAFFTSVPAILKQLVLSQQKDTLKAGLMLEAMTALLLISQRIEVEERKELITSDMMTHLTELKGSFNKDLRKMYNRYMEHLNSANRKSQKAKKRKHAEIEEKENGTELT